MLFKLVKKPSKIAKYPTPPKMTAGKVNDLNTISITHKAKTQSSVQNKNSLENSNSNKEKDGVNHRQFTSTSVPDWLTTKNKEKSKSTTQNKNLFGNFGELEIGNHSKQHLVNVLDVKNAETKECEVKSKNSIQDKNIMENTDDSFLAPSPTSMSIPVKDTHGLFNKCSISLTNNSFLDKPAVINLFEKAVVSSVLPITFNNNLQKALSSNNFDNENDSNQTVMSMFKENIKGQCNILSSIKELLESNRAMRDFMSTNYKSMAGSDDNFTINFNKFFPARNKDHLMIIEDQLESDDFTNKLRTCLKYTGGIHIQQFVKRVMDIILSVEIGEFLNYSGKRKRQGDAKKVGFSKLKLYRVVLDVCHLKFLSTSENLFDNQIQSWIRHSKERQNRLDAAETTYQH